MRIDAPVQRQLEAYNDRDLARFIVEYSDDVRVFRPPATEPVISGKAALSAHYAANRFNLPNLHAELVGRLIVGNKVIDHERITGVGDGVMEVAVVCEVEGDRIKTVWLFSATWRDNIQPATQ